MTRPLDTVGWPSIPLGTRRDSSHRVRDEYRGVVHVDPTGSEAPRFLDLRVSEVDVVFEDDVATSVTMHVHGDALGGLEAAWGPAVVEKNTARWSGEGVQATLEGRKLTISR